MTFMKRKRAGEGRLRKGKSEGLQDIFPLNFLEQLSKCHTIRFFLIMFLTYILKQKSPNGKK